MTLRVEGAAVLRFSIFYILTHYDQTKQVRTIVHVVRVQTNKTESRQVR